MSGSKPSPELVAGLRGLAASRRGAARATSAGGGRVEKAAGAPAEEACELCGAALRPDHRHLLELGERRIVCACEPCWSVRSGEAGYRPVGVRVSWLEGFELPDEAWAALGIPIGLAFFIRTGRPERAVALYPSPAGTTEAEIEAEAWQRLERLNPVLGGLEPDCEAFVVDRTGPEHRYAIAPIDDCYRLVGMIKASWEGISGGPGPARAVVSFFAELRGRAATPGRASGSGSGAMA